MPFLFLFTTLAEAAGHEMCQRNTPVLAQSEDQWRSRLYKEEDEKQKGLSAKRHQSAWTVAWPRSQDIGF